MHSRHSMMFGACALLLGCASTVFLDHPRDAETADAAITDAAITDATPDHAPTDASRGACYTEEGTGALCPGAAVAQTDPARPSYRVTQLKITSPAALASPLLGNVVNGSIHTGGFLWGATLDLPGATMRAGALELVERGTVGQGLLDGRFRFRSGTEWSPGNGPLSISGDRVTSSTLDPTVRLPVYDGSGALSTVLPLRCLRFLDVSLADRRCVGLAQPAGGRIDECSGSWNTADATTVPYGRFSAVITIGDARAIQVSSVMSTLCSLLAGASCDSVAQDMWTRQPDGMCDGAPGYTFTAEFAAVSAHVE